MDNYEQRKAKLVQYLKKENLKTVQLKKQTVSNLFRYSTKEAKPIPSTQSSINLQNFNHVLGLDTQNLILEVEGLTTFETIVNHLLPAGFLPWIVPELKHITIGGAIVGIGIESNGFKFGFVHDSLVEAEVLLPSGDVVLCKEDNEHQELFYALPNSYGTLGYILKAKLRIYPVKSFVFVQSKCYTNLGDYLEAMRKAADQAIVDFLEGLIFSDTECYLITGEFKETASSPLNIYKNIYYKKLRTRQSFYLNTKDYLFRYDPDWFWNLPESSFYQIFRYIAPKTLRHSAFYKKYIHVKERILRFFLPKNSQYLHRKEPLIQDWELPWDKAHEFLRFALDTADLKGKPWLAVPIKPQRVSTLYPVKPKHLYFNLGCYCLLSNRPESHAFQLTKILDSKCFELGGIKMLYSSSFMRETDFNKIYNGKLYQAIKMQYDPNNIKPTLYKKCIG